VVNNLKNKIHENITLQKPQPLTPSPYGEGELPLQMERVGVRF
jgi:hypothetical protein